MNKEGSPKRKIADKLLFFGIAAGLFLASYVPQVASLINTEPKPVAAAAAKDTEPEMTPTIHIFTPTPTPGEGTVYPTATPTPDPCEISAASPADTDIVCGKPAVPHEYPFMVNIGGCGGTLIDPEWVLSAAHCFDDLRDTDQITIKLGDHYIEKGTEEPDELYTFRLNSSAVILHPLFDNVTSNNDIALIKLPVSVALTDTVQLVAPITSSQEQQLIPTAGVTTTVIGWGALEFGGFPPSELHEVDVLSVDWQACHDAYAALGSVISNHMVCAGYWGKGVKDSCQGDSGGPLLVWDEEHQSWLQYGIVSKGKRCAEPWYMGVYTQVSDYSTWIEGTMSGTFAHWLPHIER